MAVDELLLELAADQGHSALRFYSWRQPTLSLGYFQCYQQRHQHTASADCPVVRRLTGGGAILHDQEITYSMALPASHPLAPLRDSLYRLAHHSLVAALGQFGVMAAMCDQPLSTARVGAIKVVSSPSSDAQQQKKEPFLCFERRAPTDVVYGGQKIAGSAQRRRRGAVLQHGSLILGKSPAAPTIAGLRDLSGIPLEPEQLINRWTHALAAALGICCEPAVLTADESCRVAELVAARYANPLWTELR